MSIFFIFILLLLIIVILAFHVRIVSQSKAYVIERLGGYLTTWQVGLNILVPFIDRIVRIVSLKEQVIDFPPQPVITKDNVTMQIDSVVYFQITDPKLYTYGVEHPMSAIENLTATTLRNIIGEMELDTTLTSRDTINTKMRAVLDEATDPWGIKINRIELKNIIPPREIQDAMEKQMKAEREKREAIRRAEGQKEAAILVAEGEKTSQILRAEAEKEAEGQAAAILSIQKAKAEAIVALNKAGATKEVLALKGMETFEKVADGKATKIIIPSELQNIASITSVVGEMFKKEEE